MSILLIMIIWLMVSVIGVKIWGLMGDWQGCVFGFNMVICLIYIFVRMLLEVDIVFREHRRNLTIHVPTSEAYITLAIIILIHLLIAIILLIVYLYKKSDIRGWLLITSLLFYIPIFIVCLFTKLLFVETILTGLITLCFGINFTYPQIKEIKNKLLKNRIKIKEKEILEYTAKKEYLYKLDQDLLKMKKDG